MPKQLPKAIDQFRKRHPDVWKAFKWKAFNLLGERCHEARPLDEKTRRLVKVALSIGAGLEGTTHSAVRSAATSGVTVEEINHVAVLAITTLGLPAAATRALTWIGDVRRTK